MHIVCFPLMHLKNMNITGSVLKSSLWPASSHHLWPTSSGCSCQMLFVLAEAARVELSIFRFSPKGHTWLQSMTPDRHLVALYS